MPSSGPNRRPHGNFITGTGGYRAFVPAALPPTIVWEETLAVRSLRRGPVHRKARG